MTEIKHYQDEIAALQEQVRALAAENIALKKFCKNAAFDADYEAELGMERGGFTDALNGIKTPATDAALRDIRAQGVEGFAQDCDDNFALVEPEDEELYALMAESAREHAARIRSGEQP